MIESIPNISEGRRQQTVEGLSTAVRRVPGLYWLDRSSDASHNRTVFTYAGRAAAVEQAASTLIEQALHVIDLRRHDGVHPRMGAVDVLPFVPLLETTMAECVGVARRVGEDVALRYDIPVFLYEEAAVRPERRRLEEIRRGGFEGLDAKMADERWRPDFGPAQSHPSFGAIAIGARPPLIAFNVNLASDRLEVARTIAAEVRERDGGLPAVKALGLALPHRGIVQVSMNLTDFRQTSPATAFAAVTEAARRAGVAVLESELVGLIPEKALAGTTAEALQLSAFSADCILEVRLAAAMRQQDV